MPDLAVNWHQKPKGGQLRAKPKTELGVLSTNTPPMHHPFAKSFLLLIVGLGLGAPIARAEIDLQNLVKNSPFGEGKAPGEKSGSLEFRGVYVDQGVTYFNIYNPATKSSTWIAQGETSTGPLNLAVKSYDETADTVVVENNGQAVKMVLHKSQIVPLVSAAPAQAEARNAASLTTAANGNATTAKDGKSNVTSEQAQAFREQMRQRWSDRQNSDKGSNTNNTSDKKKSDGNGNADNSNAETKKSKKNVQ